MPYELVEVSDAADWVAYHAIRRQELFENRGRIGIYDENRPEEREPNQHHYLLKHDGKPIGTTRLELRDNNRAIYRLVAITATEQGKGHGRVLSDLVDTKARGFGVKTLLVNAAETAVGYYEKTGWRRHEWDACELVGIASTCIQMRRDL